MTSLPCFLFVHAGALFAPGPPLPKGGVLEDLRQTGGAWAKLGQGCVEGTWKLDAVRLAPTPQRAHPIKKGR